MATGHQNIPSNQEIFRLEHHLHELAEKWREAEGDADRQRILVTSYHRAMIRLYQLGWDESLAPEDELPEWLMPREYIQRTTTHAGVPEGFFRNFRRENK